jgi:hypothetical protein
MLLEKDTSASETPALHIVKRDQLVENRKIPTK